MEQKKLVLVLCNYEMIFNITALIKVLLKENNMQSCLILTHILHREGSVQSGTNINVKLLHKNTKILHNLSVKSTCWQLFEIPGILKFLYHLNGTLTMTTSVKVELNQKKKHLYREKQKKEFSFIPFVP